MSAQILQLSYNIGTVVTTQGATTRTAVTPAANAVVRTVPAQGFRNCAVNFIYAGTASYTFKFVKSQQEAKPDFAAAASATNQWEYSNMVNLDSGASVTGSTGVVVSGDGAASYEFNIQTARWFGIICSAYTSGTVDGTVLLSNNG